MNEEAVFLTRAQKLELARTSRQQEIEDYQINIDNYTLAICVIDALPENEQAEQSAFRKQLENLLASEKREQAKSKIMAQALEAQIASL